MLFHVVSVLYEWSKNIDVSTDFNEHRLHETLETHSIISTKKVLGAS